MGRPVEQACSAVWIGLKPHSHSRLSKLEKKKGSMFTCKSMTGKKFEREEIVSCLKSLQCLRLERSSQGSCRGRPLGGRQRANDKSVILSALHAIRLPKSGQHQRWVFPEGIYGLDVVAPRQQTARDPVLN